MHWEAESSELILPCSEDDTKNWGQTAVNNANQYDKSEFRNNCLDLLESVYEIIVYDFILKQNGENGR